MVVMAVCENAGCTEVETHTVADYTRCDDPACTTHTTEPLSGAGQVRNRYTTAEVTLLVTESSNALYLNICPADNCLS